MNATIKRHAAGYIIDVRGEESPGQKFFVGKITFEETRWHTCPHCYTCFQANGSVPRSVFPEDSVDLDSGNIKYCIVCGGKLD